MSRDLIPVFYAYLAALAVAVAVIILLPFGVLMKTFIADMAATFVIFGFSRNYKNSSFYDAYWSLAPPAIALYWAFAFGWNDANVVPTLVVTALVIWWGARLTLNWASHWTGLSHEDWRYGPIRDKAGKHAVLADLAGIHIFPTLIVFAACLPLYAVFKFGSAPMGVFDYLAMIFTAAAIILETISDVQLHRFVKTKKTGEFIKTGIWKYSRHPNYCGELGFWVGLSAIGLAAHPAGWWWIIPGALMMGLMFFCVSIPLMDERSLASRPGYDDHMKRVSAIIPWFPK